MAERRGLGRGVVLEDRRPVEGVEALEPALAVVVAVRVLPAAQEVAGELDLVRGVVREEPGLRRVAQARLEDDGGDEEAREHDERDRAEEPRAPGEREERARPRAPAITRPPTSAPARRASGSHSSPTASTTQPSGPDPVIEPGLERPRVGPEERHVQEDEAGRGSRARPSPRGVRASLRPAHARPAREPEARERKRLSGRLGRREVARGERQHAPGVGVFEEQAVGERVNEEDDEGRYEREAEGLVLAADERERPDRSAEEREVDARRPRSRARRATVSGAVWETCASGAPRPYTSSRVASGWPATPTPNAGWFPTTVAVSLTSWERSLVTRSADSWRSRSTRKTAPTTATTTAAAPERAPDAPVGDEEGRDEHARGERHEARLRVGEEEAGPEEGDEAQRRARGGSGRARARPRGRRSRARDGGRRCSGRRRAT